MKLKNSLKILIVITCFLNSSINSGIYFTGVHNQKSFNKVIHECVKNLRNGSCSQSKSPTSSYNNDSWLSSKNEPVDDSRKKDKSKKIKPGAPNSTCRNNELSQCIHIIKSYPDLKFEPHKMKKSINFRKTTELLALTEKPRNGFLRGDGQEAPHKNRLTIYFIALLNAIWDDLKKDPKMVDVINIAAEKSPNEILRDSYKQWYGMFKENEKEGSIKFFTNRAMAFMMGQI